MRSQRLQSNLKNGRKLSGFQDSKILHWKISQQILLLQWYENGIILAYYLERTAAPQEDVIYLFANDIA